MVAAAALGPEVHLFQLETTDPSMLAGPAYHPSLSYLLNVFSYSNSAGEIYGNLVPASSGYIIFFPAHLPRMQPLPATLATKQGGLHAFEF